MYVVCSAPELILQTRAPGQQSRRFYYERSR
nr:MAG TPA: hypothetical protein [Caudoviricetes sp.]